MVWYPSLIRRPSRIPTCFKVFDLPSDRINCITRTSAYAVASPAARSPSHRRTVIYQSYRRVGHRGRTARQKRRSLTTIWSAGCCSVESLFTDMAARITIDNDMAVRAVEVDMRATPFSLCGDSAGACQSLVGAKPGERWRQTLNQHLGGARDRTHLREVLFGVATVAMQKLWAHFREQALRAGEEPERGQHRPHFVGSCYSWAVNRSVVARYLPQFYERDE